MFQRYGMTLFILLGMLVLLGVGGYAQTVEQTRVRAVQIDGYQLLSENPADASFSALGVEVRAQVAGIVAPLVDGAPDTRLLDATAERIMALGWFANVRHETVPGDEGFVDVRFTVRENVRIHRIEFTGNRSINSETLAALLTSKPGILNFASVRADARAITEAFQRDGYVFSELIDRTIREDPISGENVLIFSIFEPRISEIRLNGLNRTRNYVVLRQLDFRVGDTFNVKSINRTLLNLDRLGIFSDVSYDPEVGAQEPGSILINLNVIEQRTGMASFGITQNNVQGWTGFLTIADTNFFGTGNRISANIRYGKSESSYQLSYAIPWIDRHRTGVSASLYDKTMLREAVDGNTSNTLKYDEHRRGFDMGISRPLNTANTSRLFFGVRSNDIKGTVSDPPADFPQTIIDEIETQKTVRSLSTSLTQDTRFPFSKPYKGHYFSFGTEVAGFLGGQDFAKFTSEGRIYLTVRADKRAAEKREAGKAPGNWVLASRLQGGVSTGVPPILDQYTVGGADSLRGYRQDRFPGENMLIWNNELRIPFNDALDLVAFIDLGDAWGGDVAKALGDEAFKLRFGYGAGLRVQTPIGPIRLDWGRNDVGGSEIYFGVGQTF